MQVIYVCSPYRGDIGKNTKFAAECWKRVLNLGGAPIAPHLYFPQFLDEDTERMKALAVNEKLIDVCQAVWVFGDVITDGMRYEIDYAEKSGKKVVRMGGKI